MSHRFFILAFATGLAAVAWVAASFIGSSWIALAMTALIAAAYLLGASELRQFRAGTQALRTRLEATTTAPAGLPEWLEGVPPSLRSAVRLRVEGERTALPGPSLTPYLVGLLVMLGMLGTFLGMVVTFKGAVFALQGSADLQAMRSALAEPIRGLGLAFGTSVAGVAASAMLGLMSAISRRERMEVARLLESRIAGVLRPLSFHHQRDETFRALQGQARALPEAVGLMEAMMQRIEQRSADLDRRLLERQGQFQREVTQAYTELARSVGGALKESVAASAAAASDTIQPIVTTAMQQVAQDTQRLHERLDLGTRTQAEALTQHFTRAEQLRLQSWTDALQQQGERMDQLGALWRTEMSALRQDEAQRGQAAVQRLGELQSAVTQHLGTLGAALEAPITRMLQTASEVPQAAADVIAQLREEMRRVTERENVAVQERTILLERLGTLLQSLEQASGQQREAVESMAASATSVLAQAHGRFGDALQAQAARAADSAVHLNASAVDLASLAEAFGASVQQFQASNEKLTDTLLRVDASLHRSTARSDEQLAYYVAQAREVIDLSISSQQGVMESLRELQARRRGEALAEESRA